MLELIALLELYNTYDQKSIYYEVAGAILEKYNSLNLDSLQDFSDSIHISTSTASRFIQQLYYQKFSVFQANHYKSKTAYLYDGKYFPSLDEKLISFQDYVDISKLELSKALSKVEQESLDAIIAAIISKKECIFIGIPIHTAIWRLQAEIVLLDKKTSAYIDPNYQIKAVERSNEDSLVFAFTYMRQDDDHTKMLLKLAQKNKATIASISHIPFFLEERNPLFLSYAGSGTRIDSLVMELIVNYIGSSLRGYLLK